MRNLIIAAIVFGSAGSLFISERAAMAKAQSRTEALARERTSLDPQIEHQRKQIQYFEARRAAQARELKQATAQLEQERSAHTNIALASLTAAAEGSWPQRRPYFYLAKRHIPAVRCSRLSRHGMITPEAAALFGMTPTERRALDNSLASIQQRLRDRELQQGYITNTPPGVERNFKGERISFFIPGNANADDIAAEFQQHTTEALGPERADLFLFNGGTFKGSILAGRFDGVDDEDRIVTIAPRDETGGNIVVSVEHGYRSGTYEQGGDSDMQFQYRHLLQALLPQLSQ